MNFSEIIEKHFDFLVSQFGYSKIPIDDTWIKYKLKQQSIVIIYDSKRSHEVSIFLEDETNIYNTIPFHVLCLAYGEPEQVKQLSCFFSQQLPVIECYLEKASIFIYEKMKPLLEGNQDELQRAHDISLTESQVYTQTRTDKVMREYAGEAWLNKDYARFLEIMNQAGFTLTDLDKRKIEFAKTR